MALAPELSAITQVYVWSRKNQWVDMNMIMLCVFG